MLRVQLNGIAKIDESLMSTTLAAQTRRTVTLILGGCNAITYIKGHAHNR